MRAAAHYWPSKVIAPSGQIAFPERCAFLCPSCCFPVFSGWYWPSRGCPSIGLTHFPILCSLNPAAAFLRLFYPYHLFANQLTPQPSGHRDQKQTQHRKCQAPWQKRLYGVGPAYEPVQKGDGQEHDGDHEMAPRGGPTANGGNDQKLGGTYQSCHNAHECSGTQEP